VTKFVVCAPMGLAAAPVRRAAIATALRERTTGQGTTAPRLQECTPLAASTPRGRSKVSLRLCPATNDKGHPKLHTPVQAHQLKLPPSPDPLPS